MQRLASARERDGKMGKRPRASETEDMMSFARRQPRRARKVYLRKMAAYLDVNRKRPKLALPLLSSATSSDVSERGSPRSSGRSKPGTSQQKTDHRRPGTSYEKRDRLRKGGASGDNKPMKKASKPVGGPRLEPKRPPSLESSRSHESKGKCGPSRPKRRVGRRKSKGSCDCKSSSSRSSRSRGKKKRGRSKKSAARKKSGYIECCIL